MTENETMLQIAEDAKKLLLEKGWIQGSFASDKGYCLYGALATNTHYYDHFDILHKLIMKILDIRCKGKSFGLASYNDYEATTIEDILSLLDEIIEPLKDKIAAERLIEEISTKRIEQLA